MTTDGAANEVGAAALLVNETNHIHCVAHTLQLVINDQLDSSQAHPPAACARHRAVLRKAHDLVVFVNGHRDAFREFSVRAQRKRQVEDGARMYDALIIDVVTRWDSELALLERLVYFDAEILDIFTLPQLGIDDTMMLDRFEFDLAYGMTLVLEPFRVVTKFAQYRDKVTLAYIPGYIDRLVDQLQPGAVGARMAGRTVGALAALEDFQRCLIESIHERFDRIFDGDSLALRARYLLPGQNLFNFQHFDFDEEVRTAVVNNLVSDAMELLPQLTEEQRVEPAVVRRRARQETAARNAIEQARDDLDEEQPEQDPLVWWPRQVHLGVLFPLAKMLFAIPDSSAEDERVFSSAGFTLNQRRTRLDLDNFRREHRIRQFLRGGAAQHQTLTDRANRLMHLLGPIAAQRQLQPQ
jgi:hypothetical protein